MNHEISTFDCPIIRQTGFFVSRANLLIVFSVNSRKKKSTGLLTCLSKIICSSLTNNEPYK